MKYLDEVEMCEIHLASTIISTTDHAGLQIDTLKHPALGEIKMVHGEHGALLITG